MLRTAPCLFGLYSVVAVLYSELAEGRRVLAIHWPGKVDVTFSDALSAVRRQLWSEWVFPHADGDRAMEKLPAPLQELVLSALTAAA